MDKEAYEEAKAYAFRLLSVRARTQREMEQRLARRGYPARVVRRVLGTLLDLGYLDDVAFARAWLDSKAAEGLPGRRLALAGLRRAGVPPQVAEEVVGRYYEDVAEADLALEAARRRAGRLVGLPRDVARRRLAAYLARRGFEREAVADALRVLEEEESG